MGGSPPPLPRVLPSLIGGANGHGGVAALPEELPSVLTPSVGVWRSRSVELGLSVSVPPRNNMIMNNKSKGGSNGNKALTVIMPNNSSNPKPIAPKVPGSNHGNKAANKNSAVPARFVYIRCNQKRSYHNCCLI